MKATQDKIHQVLLLLKAACDDVEKHSSTLDPVYAELATSLGCAARARRMLSARVNDNEPVPA